MRNKILIALSLILFSTSSCRGNNEFVWGVFCLECTNNCSRIFKINNSGMYENENSFDFVEYISFRKSSNKRFEFDGRKLSDSIYHSFKTIIEDMPVKFKNLRGVIGDPDGTDKCGYYFQLFNGDFVQKVEFEPKKIPQDIHPFVRRLYNFEFIE